MIEGCSREYDIRNDELQKQRKLDCESLLVAAGYFRARIVGLDIFDKIVGGMVWCFSALHEDLDVDFLYSTSSTIKSKIALTEKIVMALIEHGCPHSLEAHQIQGLDFIHIYPVVQWLVKEALEKRKQSTFMLQETAQRMALRKLTNGPVDPTAPIEQIDKFYKRTSETKPETLVADALCTLAEYGHEYREAAEEENEEEMPELDGLEQSSSQRKVPQVHMEQFQKKKLLNTPMTIPELKSAIAEYERRIQDQKDLRQRQKIKKESITKKLLELTSETNAVEFRELLKKEASLKEVLKALHDETEQKLNKNRSCIERLKMNNDLLMNEENSQKLLSDSEKQLSEVKKIAAEKSQNVSNLQHKLDSCLTSAVANVYLKRELERWNDVARLGRYTKCSIMRYNSAVDTGTFHQKAIDFTERIEDILPRTNDEEYLNSFCKVMQEIVNSVSVYHKKISQEVDDMNAEKVNCCEALGKQAEWVKKFHRYTATLKQVFDKDST